MNKEQIVEILIEYLPRHLAEFCAKEILKLQAPTHHISLGGNKDIGLVKFEKKF